MHRYNRYNRYNGYPRYHAKYPKFIGFFLGLQLLSKPKYVESLYLDITLVQLNGKFMTKDAVREKVFNYKRKIWSNTRLDFFKCDIESPLAFIIDIKILEVCSRVSNPQFMRNSMEICNANMYR